MVKDPLNDNQLFSQPKRYTCVTLFDRFILLSEPLKIQSTSNDNPLISQPL